MENSTMQKTVLFYGDSNTYGYDPRFVYGGRYPAEVRWTDQLRQALEGRWNVLDDGMNGRCIPSETGTRWFLQELKELPPVDLLAVMLGSNDYLNMRSPDPNAVAMKLKAFLDAVRDSGLVPEILVLSPPYIDFPEYPAFSRFSTRDGRLSAAIRAMVSEYPNGVFFENTESWGLETAFDGVHLSPQGHRAFAEHMKAWFEERL